MLPVLHQKGYFLAQARIEYDSREALHQLFPNAGKKLHMPALRLIIEPIPFTPPTTETVVQDDHLAKSFKPLTPKINEYIDKLCQVLSNTLAERNYEVGIPDSENVSERVHALQAGLIAYRLGLNPIHVAAMLFHDISRCTKEEIAYSHRYHHAESSRILTPLGAVKDYTFNHPFAKFLLHAFSGVYRKHLLSPLSQNSLTMQSDSFAASVRRLSVHQNDKLAEALFQIMAMRAIDDFSKVPEHLLRSSLDASRHYFDNDTIKQLLVYVMANHLIKLPTDERTVAQFRHDLSAAMTILSRVDYLQPEKKSGCKP
jgi:predicted HD phosphohydrolase